MVRGRYQRQLLIMTSEAALAESFSLTTLLHAKLLGRIEAPAPDSFPHAANTATAPHDARIDRA